MNTVLHKLISVLKLSRNVFRAQVAGALRPLKVSDLILSLEHEIREEVELGAVRCVHVLQLVAQVIVHLGLLSDEDLSSQERRRMRNLFLADRVDHVSILALHATTTRITASLTILVTPTLSN